MKNFVLNNKKFLISILVFLIFAALYYFYKALKVSNKIENKEIVYITLRNGEIVKGLPELIDQFNEANDDIYIELTLYDLDYNNVVTTELANERGADIIQYSGKTMLEKDFILPLDELNIDYSSIGDDGLFKLNDEVIGIKYGSSMPKLMYNDDILKKAGLDSKNKPETFDELIVMLKQIKDNVKGVVPLDLSMQNIHDIFSFFGTVAATEDTIYPTFWNYKTAEYDYEALKPVLEKFKYMYENGLINIDFDEKKDADIFSDFKNGKSAIAFTASYKKYTIVDRTFNLHVSFSDIPQLTKIEGRRYYYTSQRILCLANNLRDTENLTESELQQLNKHEEAVRTVYQWLISKDTVDFLTSRDANYATFGDNPFDGSRTYDPVNYDKGYNQSKYDPTEVLAGNSKMIQNAIYSIVKEGKDVTTEVDKLNKEMNDFIKTNKRNKDVNLDKYKE